ncbi:MAG: hypothetical protein JST04_00140 [Bdellovibrionales bacterium]|nr:hypothetical protein [Bdellovibrionales bacterium]
MLVLMPSRTLSRRLKVSADTVADKPTDHPMAKWCARDFRLGTWQVVLFMNPETTLSIVMDAAPYGTLVDRFREFLPAYFENLGWDDVHEILGPTLSAGVEFRKNTDRSMTGLMNKLVMDLSYYDFSDRDVGSINSFLLKYLLGGKRPDGYEYPITRFHRWLETASPASGLKLVWSKSDGS